MLQKSNNAKGEVTLSLNSVVLNETMDPHDVADCFSSRLTPFPSNFARTEPPIAPYTCLCTGNDREKTW